MDDPIEELKRMVSTPVSSSEHWDTSSFPGITSVGSLAGLRVITPSERLTESMELRRIQLLSNKLGYLTPKYILELFGIPWESRKYIQKMHRDHVLGVVYPNIKTHKTTSDDFLFLEAAKMLYWITTICPGIIRSLNEGVSIVYRKKESDYMEKYLNFDEHYNEDILYSGYDMYMNIVLNNKYKSEEDIVYYFNDYCHKSSMYNFKEFKDIAHIKNDINYLSLFILQFEYVYSNLERTLEKLAGKDSIYKFAPLTILWSYVQSEIHPIDMSSREYSLSN